MAWRQTGNKPLSEPMMTYMRHSASMGQINPLDIVKSAKQP